MALSLPIVDPPTSLARKMPLARPSRSGAPDQLIDSHGRVIHDLRLSITDRCNFRCVYCLDPGASFLKRGALLSTDELIRITSVCASLGIDKVRITGGEPTVHPELDTIVASLSQLGIEDLAMTTNGATLSRARLEQLRDAGLARLTFSLDCLDPVRFAAMTRSNTSVQTVINTIRAAVDVGLSPVRINAVVIRGYNEDDVPDLAGLARQLGVDVRFIEFMPLDAAHEWRRTRVVGADEILARIEAAYPLEPTGRAHKSSTSMTYRFRDGAPGQIGIIAPVTHPFCGACSRLRVTADGKVRPCLFSHDEWDLRPLLRGGASDNDLAEFLQDATWAKQKGHGIGSPGFTPPARTMSAIGG